MTARGRPRGSKNAPKKAKPIPTRTTFTLPEHGGAEDFFDLVKDCGGIDQVAKDLRISVDLVKRYAAGSLPIPYVTWVALWWQSWRGFNQAFSETHATHLHNFDMRRQAELERYILMRVMTKAIETLPADHPIGEMLALGLHKAKNPPPLTKLQMEFMDASIAGRTRFPFLSPEVATRLECKLRNAGLVMPGETSELLMSYT